MHELPDKHQEIQLLGDPQSLDEASGFLAEKGYRVTRCIVANPAFWDWAASEELTAEGCQSVPLWRANPLLIRAIDAIEQRTSGRKALDLACGAGRDAVFLAQRGWDVTAIDIKQDALDRCQSLAQSSGCKVITRQADMETADNPLQTERFDLIVVMRYLHRPFLPQLYDHLNDKGMLVYSTFMVGSEKYGSPRNPNFLLKPNELVDTFPGLVPVINETHRLADGRPVAHYLGQKS